MCIDEVEPAPVWIGWLGETLNPGLGLLVDAYYWVRKTAKWIVRSRRTAEQGIDAVLSVIDYVNHPLLKWIHANVNKEKMPSPSVEIALTGVQNRRILSGLLLSRLVAKNKAKNDTARIQNKGEQRLSRKPPATAAKPVALELLIGQRAETSPASSATNIAATAH